MNKTSLKEKKAYKKRKRWKKWKRKKNVLKNSQKKQKQAKSKKNRYQRKTRVLKVPTNFSLTSNTEGVLKFVEECKGVRLQKVDHIFFDFYNVNDVTQGAMALLLSICHDLVFDNITVGGNLPNDKDAKEVFASCGFLEFMNTNIRATKKHNNSILVQGGLKIDQVRTAPQVEKAMETVFGKRGRNQKIQGMIIEMMTNSVNHAFLEKKEATKWYLSVFHEEKEKRVKFCFIDNGEGILETIHIKFFNTLTKLVNPANILKKSFEGIIGSRTQQLERGTGLVLIKNCQLKNAITNLKVITNNLFYDFGSETITELKIDFRGTFYFWELDTTCQNVNY